MNFFMLLFALFPCLNSYAWSQPLEIFKKYFIENKMMKAWKFDFSPLSLSDGGPFLYVYMH